MLRIRNLPPDNFKSGLVVLPPVIPKNSDFVSKIFAVVKTNRSGKNVKYIRPRIEELRNVIPQKNLSFPEIQRIIIRVKAISNVNLPKIYHQMILGLCPLSLPTTSSQRLGCLLHFSKLDPLFRIECAKIDLYRDADTFCKNFRRYNIVDPAIRVRFGKLVAQENGRAISEHINEFAIPDEKGRAEIAELAAKQDGSSVSAFIRNYAITDPKKRFEIAKIVAALNGWGLVFDIQNYDIEKEEDRIELAKQIAQHNGEGISIRIERFGIKNKVALFEIFRLALKQNASVAVFFSKFGIKQLNWRLELILICLSSREVYHVHHLLNKEVISHCLELSFWGFANNPKKLFSFFSRLNKKSNLSQSKIDRLFTLFQKFKEQNNPLLKESSCQRFLLYGCILAFSKRSEMLAEAFIRLANGLEDEKDFVRKKEKRHWLARLLLGAAVNKVPQETLLSHMGFVEVLLNLKEPSLRLRLQDHLFHFFADPSAMKSFEVQKGFVLTDGGTKRGILLVPLMMAAPYVQEIGLGSIAELLTKDFTNTMLIKSLLSSLDILLSDPRLNHLEKKKVLEKIIFVKGGTTKERVKRIHLTAQMVAQCLEFGEMGRLQKIEGPKALIEQMKDVFVSTMQLGPIEQFDEKYAKTILSCRQTGALMTYAARMKSLSTKEQEVVFPAIQIYTRSVLNGSYLDERYDLASSEHLRKIFEIDPELFKRWVQGAQFTIEHNRIVDTADPSDMLLAGTEVDSCLRVDGATIFSKCLTAYLLKGEIRMMALTTEEGVIKARCMIRLLLDLKKNIVILFQEKIYPKNCHQDHRRLLNIACNRRANDLRVPLLSKELKESVYPNSVQCLPGRKCFEYVDALIGPDDPTLKAIALGEKGYVIKGARLIPCG